MKKSLLYLSITSVLAIGLSTTASAALTNGATLVFDPGVVVTSTYGSYVTGGSYFGMDTNGDLVIKKRERTAISMNDGLVLGTAQVATGSHTGLPGCVPGTTYPYAGVCNDTAPSSEAPGIDNPWAFFGNTGMSFTNSPANVLSSTGNTATVDFSGWGWAWDSTFVDMSTLAWAGNADGVATVICGKDCGDGDTFSLDYSATVPVDSPAYLGGVRYLLHLEGVISAVPVPAAMWLFGSGLLGLAAMGRVRKQRK